MYKIYIYSCDALKPIHMIEEVHEIETVVQMVSGLYKEYKKIKDFYGTIKIESLNGRNLFLDVDENSLPVEHIKNLITYIRIRMQLWEWEENNKYPVLDIEKKKYPYAEYPCFIYAPYKIYEDYIDVKNVFGDNWAFEKKENRGNYPRISKMESILKGFLEIEGPNTVPPAPIVKINGMYFLSEGNHRLYLSKLLERKKLFVEVCEYDYDEFLSSAYILEQGRKNRIVYQGIVYSISEEEMAVFQQLKNNM